MKESKFAAIILSAGFSSRMGEYKPLLPIGGMPVIKHAINTFLSAGIDNILVVTGYRSDELDNLLNEMNIAYVKNPDYEKGMFTSVKTGTKALKQCDAFFLLPVDIPLIRKYTIEYMKKAWPDNECKILYPAFMDRRGHPPLISAEFTNGILEYSGEGGLKAFLQMNDKFALDLKTADRGILLDCDTPDDYKILLEHYDYWDFPNESECFELLKNVFNINNSIILHSAKVASLAVFFGSKLHMSSRDLRILNSAGLLHDIAREKPDHARAGASVIREMQYPEIADIIGSHMNISLDKDNERIDSSQILYLSDKLIDGEDIAGLESRFRKKIENTNDAAVKSKIKERLQNALIIKDRIEKITGRTLDNLIYEYANNRKNNPKNILNKK